MIHSLRLAVFSLNRYSIGEKSRGRIPSQPQKLSSAVVAHGTAYGCQGLDRQG
jgi:hypothetical protein